MGVRILYSSLRSLGTRKIAEAAIRAAVGQLEGDWVASLVEAPQQPHLVVIDLEGPWGSADHGHLRTKNIGSTRFAHLSKPNCRTAP